MERERKTNERAGKTRGDWGRGRGNPTKMDLVNTYVDHPTAANRLQCVMINVGMNSLSQYPNGSVGGKSW